MDKIDYKIPGPMFVFLWFFLLITALHTKEAYALETFKRHYLDGMKYMQKAQYEKAINSFTEAIKGNDIENERMRFYGMRYIEYIPHLKKGICYFQLKQYGKAIKEFEISLNQVKSSVAQKYLERAKMEGGFLVQTPKELKKIRVAKEENRYGVGVIIGNRDYEDKDIPAVKYAIQDAAMVKKYLIKTFGYREGNIIDKTNATKGTFENIFGSVSNYEGKLYRTVKRGKSDVFIYYSGHGAPHLATKSGYILPVDSSLHNVIISGYPLNLLYDNLKKLGARSITVVTDACFSGALLLTEASPVGITIVPPIVSKKNTAIINSCTQTQLSSWYPQKGHSLFTYYFLLGLTGRADQNDDNQISFREFSGYLNDHVPYKASELHPGREQTPTLITQNENRTIVEYK